MSDMLVLVYKYLFYNKDIYLFLVVVMYILLTIHRHENRIDDS